MTGDLTMWTCDWCKVTARAQHVIAGQGWGLPPGWVGTDDVLCKECATAVERAIDQVRKERSKP